MARTSGSTDINLLRIEEDLPQAHLCLAPVNVENLP